MPIITEAFDVEMIRDGGSFAATFGGQDGNRYILFMKIKIADRRELTKERIGYEQPLLIDCDPSKQPLVPGLHTYIELNGPRNSVTWAEARALMTLFTGLDERLPEWRRKWLDCVNYVVTNDGAMPPSMDRILRSFRPMESELSSR